MSKRLIIILALAFVVGITCAAYAEVQNVKVSGDIDVKGVARNNFDLAKSQVYGITGAANYDDRESNFLTITRVRVDADLTDNVSTTVRLLNERNWNGEGTTTAGAAGDNKGQTLANTNIGLNTGITTQESQIDLDLAYATLKEFLYSPLSVTIGRQELHFGNDLIVGDPDTNIYSGKTSLSQGDLSARKAFDAIRATLDYNPVVVDLVYAKVQEGNVNLNDDVTLSGINARYDLNKNTTIEGYLFSKVKGTNAGSVYNIDAMNNTSFGAAAGVVAAGSDAVNPLKDKSDIVNAVGVRAIDKTVKNLILDGEVAFQFGRYNPRFDPNAYYDTLVVSRPRKAETTEREAWALQLTASYDLKDVDMLSKYSPVISGSYIYLSGADRDRVRGKDHYKGWDPMFENQTRGHIMNAIFANTNMQAGSLSARAKLTDDITANLDYIGAWFAKRYPKDLDRLAILSGVAGTTAATSGRQFILKGGRYIGSEIDATLTYDYTEDVQFSLLGGLFLVGNNIRDINHPASKGNKANAAELIGSMKVTF